MSIARLPEHAQRRDATLADLAMMGFELGKQCAQRLLRGYATDPAEPDPADLGVLILFVREREGFVADQRKTNGLTDAGESAYRTGFQRGLVVQLVNPRANVKLEIEKA